MSNAYKCDKCGVFQGGKPPTHYFCNFPELPNEASPVGKRFYLEVKYIDSKSLREAELCTKCLHEMTKKAGFREAPPRDADGRIIDE